MELSSFSENIVTVPIVRSGETVELQVDIDAFTPPFFRAVGTRLKARLAELTKEAEREAKAAKKPKRARKKADEYGLFEDEARALEVKREIYAEFLTIGDAPVLRNWSVTDGGAPIKPTREVVVRLPPRLVEEMWDLAVERSRTVKKTVENSETPIPTTNEIIAGGSQAPVESSDQTM